MAFFKSLSNIQISLDQDATCITFFKFSTLPSTGITPCVGTTWKWHRRHTLAMPCLAALGLVCSWVERQLTANI